MIFFVNFYILSILSTGLCCQYFYILSILSNWFVLSILMSSLRSDGVTTLGLHDIQINNVFL